MRRLITAFSLLAVVACDAQETTRPAVRDEAVVARSLVSAEDANQFFFWQPPVVRAASEVEEFDASLYEFLTLKVCAATDPECASPIAEYAAGSGLDMNLDEKRFRTLFRVPRGTTGIRLVALAGHVELGRIDLDVSDLRTLPIQFSVEKGALSGVGAGVVGRAGGTVRSPSGAASLEIPSGALEGPTVLSIRPSDDMPPEVLESASLAGTAFELAPSGIEFSAPVTVRLPIPASWGGTTYLGVLHWSDNGAASPMSAAREDGMLASDISSFSLVAVMESATPWQVLNVKWGIETVSWYVDGTTFSDRDRIRVLASQAFRAWEDVQGSLRFEEAASRGDAQIVFEGKPRIGWVDKLLCGFGLDATTGGYTCFNVLQGGTTLTESDQVEIWLDTGLVAGLPIIGALSLVMHEVGHSIGVAHPVVETDPAQVMASTLDGAAVDLGQYDISAVQYHYGPPSGSFDRAEYMRYCTYPPKVACASVVLETLFVPDGWLGGPGTRMTFMIRNEHGSEPGGTLAVSALSDFGIFVEGSDGMDNYLAGSIPPGGIQIVNYPTIDLPSVGPVPPEDWSVAALSGSDARVALDISGRSNPTLSVLVGCDGIPSWVLNGPIQGYRTCNADEWFKITTMTAGRWRASDAQVSWVAHFGLFYPSPDQVACEVKGERFDNCS